jgi:hypothetical protein
MRLKSGKKSRPKKLIQSINFPFSIAFIIFQIIKLILSLFKHCSFADFARRKKLQRKSEMEKRNPHYVKFVVNYLIVLIFLG